MSMLNMLLGIGAKPDLVWSGNATVSLAGSPGFITSGKTYKWKSYNTTADSFGQIQSVNSDGIFSGNSITSYLDGIIVSGNLLRPTTGYDYAPSNTFATYSVATKTFSGTGLADNSVSGDQARFETSGGLMRFGWYPDGSSNLFSNYISLT